MKGKIFNAQEVQAIIAGSKVMFREVIKPQPPKNMAEAWLNEHGLGVMFANNKAAKKLETFPEDRSQYVKCPYKVGQEIFVKESWNAFSGEALGTPLGKMRLYSYPPKEGNIITYKADADLTKDFTSYLSSRTMPQWASRLTLRITGIKVEKLADISEEDCHKEGIKASEHIVNFDDSPCYVINFRKNWNATHKKPEEKFEASPWVWVMNFSIINN